MLLNKWNWNHDVTLTWSANSIFLDSLWTHFGLTWTTAWLKSMLRGFHGIPNSNGLSSLSLPQTSWKKGEDQLNEAPLWYTATVKLVEGTRVQLVQLKLWLFEMIWAQATGWGSHQTMLKFQERQVDCRNAQADLNSHHGHLGISSHGLVGNFSWSSMIFLWKTKDSHYLPLKKWLPKSTNPQRL